MKRFLFSLFLFVSSFASLAQIKTPAPTLTYRQGNGNELDMIISSAGTLLSPSNSLTITAEIRLSDVGRIIATVPMTAVDTLDGTIRGILPALDPSVYYLGLYIKYASGEPEFRVGIGYIEIVPKGSLRVVTDATGLNIQISEVRQVLNVKLDATPSTAIAAFYAQQARADAQVTVQSNSAAQTAAGTASTKAAEVATAKAQIDIIKTGIDAAQADVTAKAEQVGANKSSVDATKGQIDGIKTSIDAAQADVNTKAGQVTTQAADVATKKGQIDLIKTAIDAAQADVTTKQSSATTASGLAQAAKTDAEAARDLALSYRNTANNSASAALAAAAQAGFAVNTAYKVVGTWNPSTNTPTLSNTTSLSVGSAYVVSTTVTAGVSSSVLSGSALTYLNGDLIVATATGSWVRIAQASIVADNSVTVGKVDRKNNGLDGNFGTFQVFPIRLGGNLNQTIARTFILPDSIVAEGYVKKFSTRTPATTDAARSIKFYVLGVSSGQYYIKYVSPAISATVSTAVVSYTPDRFTVRILPGDAIAATSTTGFLVTSSATGYSYKYLSTNAPVSTTLYTASTVSNQNISLGAEIESAVTTPTVDSRDTEGGMPQLGTDGRLRGRNTPEYLGGKAALPRDNTNLTLNYESKKINLSTGGTSVVTNKVGSISSAATGTVAGGIQIPYLTANPGFTTSGTLTNLRLNAPGSSVAAGNVVQAWVVRPTNLSQGQFRVIHQIGQITVDSNAYRIEFRDLRLAVKQGDMIALRGTNGLGLFSNDGTYSKYVKTNLATYGLSSLSDFDNIWAAEPMTVSTAGFPAYEVDILTGPQTSSVDMTSPFYGKKIVFAGTSITQDGLTSDGFPKYVNIIASRLGGNLINVGLASSGIAYNSTFSLSRTAAESSDPNYSYERKIIPYHADYLFLDHGYNDRSAQMGTSADTSRTTLWGAYKRVIEAYYADRPDGRVGLITPPSAYGGAWDGSNKLVIENIAATIKAIGAYYKIPVLDLTNEGGFNQFNWPSYTTSVDQTHPRGAGHALMARMVEAWLRRWF